MLYCCEVCKATYNTEHDALDCEKRHAEEKAKREELNKQRDERVDEIKSDYKALHEKVEKYRKDYGTYPRVRNSNTDIIEDIFKFWW